MAADLQRAVQAALTDLRHRSRYSRTVGGRDAARRQCARFVNPRPHVCCALVQTAESLPIALCGRGRGHRTDANDKTMPQEGLLTGFVNTACRSGVAGWSAWLCRSA